MRLTSILSVPLSFLAFVTIAQSNKIDSLRELLSVQSDPQSLVQTYWNLCFEYADVDNDLALMYGKKSYSLATDISDSAMIVKAARMTAYVYRQMEFIDSSNALCLKVLPIAEQCGTIEERAKLVRGMALNYLWMGEYVLALDYNLEAYRLSIRTGDPNYLVSVLNNMGLIYYKMSNYDKALSYYESALAMQGSNLCEDHTLYLNQSLCYSALKKYDSSRQAISDALRVYPSLEKDNNLEYLFTLASNYGAQEDFNRAIHYYDVLWEEAVRRNNRRYQLDCAVCLIDIAIKQNQKEKALAYLKKIEHLIGRTSYRNHMMGIYMKLADLYKRNNDIARFVSFQSKYIQLKDSLYNNEYINDMVRVERKHVAEQKNEQIARQQQELNETEKAMERQKYLSWFIGILSVLLVAFLMVVYRSYQQGKKMNMQLNEKVRERTQELESVNMSLTRHLETELAIRNKIVADVKHASLTIKALLEIALKDSEKEKSLKEIKAVADSLIIETETACKFNLKQSNSSTI